MHTGQRLAPAKLNLSLEVLAKRPDGYHALRSVAIPIGLYDVLSWQPASHFSFGCNDPEIAGPHNLVVRTAEALGLDKLPLAFTLNKNIPQAAGLGGGSSNAAALLLAARKGAFGLQTRTDWLAVAARIGSDVPLFLVEGPALIEGRGERITALGAGPHWWAVIVYPGCRISTHLAYTLLDEAGSRPSRPRSHSISLALATALQRREFDEVCSLLSNDFEEPIAATWPAVATIQALCRNVGYRAHLSGSGAALYTLFVTHDEAQNFQARFIAQDTLPPGTRLYVAPFTAASCWREEYTTMEISP